MTLGFTVQLCAFTGITRQRYSGIVYGANGPVSGVYVSAEDASGGGGSGFAVTDASGHFSMTTGLVSDMYNLTTFAIGYIPGERDLVNVTAGQTTSGMDIAIQASGGISGTVTDAVSSNPINGTNVFASLSNGTSSFGFYATTGTDGKYFMATNLASGLYNVSTLIAPDGYIKSMTTATVVAGVETKNVNLQLAKSGIISGNVHAPNGTGLFGISVSALGSSANYGSATTDISGNYRIATGLSTDNYTVGAFGAGNFTEYSGNPVSVTAGQETSGINMELTPYTSPPTPSGTITGRITDQSNGNPIRGADISVSGTGGFGSGTSDSNGYYNVSSGLGTGTDYNVSVTASGYYDAYYQTLVSVTVGVTTPNINIQMTAKPATLYGTITGTVTGSGTVLIPEFPYPLIAMLGLMLATVVAAKLMLKKKRYAYNGNPT